MHPILNSLAAIAVAGTLLNPGVARAHEEGSRLSEEVWDQIADLRRATASFHDIEAAFAAGYGPSPVVDIHGHACIDQPGQGAMGIHYVNGNLLTPHLNPLQPQAMIYEPMPGGRMKLVAVEYIVFKSAWDGLFAGTTPVLFEQPFELVRAGNRYGLPDFYELHLWLWQPNRSGMFADWNPAVKCR